MSPRNRLYVNVGRCKMFSRCRYDLSFIPGISVVARLCTLSIAIMCFFKYGFQTDSA